MAQGIRLSGQQRRCVNTKPKKEVILITDWSMYACRFNRRDYSEIGVVKEVQRNCGEVCRRIYVVYQAPVPASRKIHDPTHDLNKAKEGQQQDVDEDDDDENVVQDLQELDQR
jgi:hypothetical protein